MMTVRHEQAPPAPAEPASSAWDEVRRWRVQLRPHLISRRMSAKDPAARDTVVDRLRAVLPDVRGRTIGCYWPLKGELSLLGLMADLITAAGATIGLPVVVEKNRPIEFWKWHPDMRMTQGFWKIPQPVEREALVPDILLVPLVGFDARCYRLGYGGGYYDRTLAALDRKPLCIGVGFELGILRTIFPQPHDIPLDAIVTESLVRRRG